jgi:phage tail sheath gpL-like
MNNIPDTILVPGVFVTVDNSLANTATGGAFKTVLFGQKTSAGTATAEELTRVFSKAGAAGLFGNGSVLDEMFDAWFKTNNISEVYAVALDDAGGSAAATQTLTVTASANAAGTLFLYVNGKLKRIGTTASQTAAQIATAIAAAITADVTLPISAAADAAVVTCTAKNKGTLGNLIDLRFNKESDQSFPVGVGVVVAAGVTGATDPDITDAIAALPDEVFKVIVNPYIDATSLGILKTELDRRWGATVQLDGHAINATGGTASTVASKGDALNSEHLTFIDSGKDTLQPSYYWAANLAGRVSFSAAADPARPFRSLGLTGLIGDTASDRRTLSEKNSILSAGIGTHNVLNDGSVVVDRLVTTYKKNAVGAADNSYQNTPTMFNLSYIRQAYITRMLSRFPRHKLADDGTVFGAGQPIATPATIKGEIIALYEEFIRDGLCENVDEFAETLIVERDQTNRSKVNVNMNPILVGQLYQFDITLQFIV